MVMNPKQQHSYWLKHSYVAVPREHLEDHRFDNAEYRIDVIDEFLEDLNIAISDATNEPPTYCIVRVDMLKNLDAPVDLADRLKLAESEYHKLQDKYNELCERFNWHD